MKFRNKIMKLSVAAALASWSVAGVAGGFAIGTQSGSGTGNAFAGGAAVADDASVVWSNPAGMTALPQGQHLTGALHLLQPSFKFSNGSSTGAFAAPGTGDGGDGGSLAFVPNGFFVTNVGPNLRLGLALNAPFGLKTDYDLGWRGQVTALQSQIKTINIQPSIAYKINNQFSLGGGISFQKIDATLTNFTGSPVVGFAQLKADDWGYGYNLGATYQPTSSTRLGAHYRSSIKYNLNGTALFNGGTASPAFAGGVTADLKVPESASLSLAQQATTNLELLGDVTWTGWSSVQQLTVLRTTASAGGAVGSTLTNLQFQWQNTWRAGFGGNYRLSPQAKLRFGVAFDKSPTKDATRTPRLPDQDRTWLAFGLQFKPSKQGTLEIAYAHEFVKNALINTTQAPFGTLNGTFKDKADIISLQYSHSF